MSAVALSYIIENFIVSLATENTQKKLKDTGIISKNNKYKRKMWKIEGDIPYSCSRNSYSAIAARKAFWVKVDL